MKKLLAICISLFALGLPQAHAFEIGVLGGLNDGKLSYGGTSTQNSSASASYAAGISLMGHLAPMVGLELDGLYARTKFNNGAGQDIAYNSFQVPLMLRVHALPFAWIGAGGYYAAGTGTPTSNGVDTTFSGNIKSSDLGLVGSVKLTASVGPMTHLNLDGRYLLGLKDLDDNAAGVAAGVTEKTREFQVLAGVSFGM